MKKDKMVYTTPIVYSTSISDNIRKAYEKYKFKKDFSNGMVISDQAKVRAAFNEFVTACENENKSFLSVIDVLS
jgi:hypothetical protein